MRVSHQHDAYTKPPTDLRKLYKEYQKHSETLDGDLEIVDFRRGLTTAQQTDVKVIGSISKEHLTSTFDAFVRETHPLERGRWHTSNDISNAPIYEHQNLPGLHIVPSLLSPDTQLHLLDRLLHRDLSNSQHKTNIHTHYHVQYPRLQAPACRQQCASEALTDTDHHDTSLKHASFFTLSAQSSQFFEPKDPELHRPLTVSKFLDRKLRWVTLGGQYDWTNKVYPTESPPVFPRDIANLLAGLFPDMKAEAAIVNLYTPGDTLSLHRDVSEDCDRGLVSISLGCDGIFIVAVPAGGDGVEGGVKHLVLRLQSGDAVYMSGPSRFAWHGVPLVVGGTCPDWLRTWPAKTAKNGTMRDDDSDVYEPWRDWMKTKRINLNVRQMRD